MIMNVDAAKRVAVRALASYGTGRDATLTFVKYRENFVFRVDEPAGSYALRLHRNGYRTDTEILEELDLVTALRAAGLAVPPVRRTAGGELFCRITDEDGDVHQVDMLEWLPDAVPFGDVAEAFTGQAAVDPGSFHALGALMADLHTKVATLRRPSPSARPVWDASGLVGDTAVWGDPRLAFLDGAAGQEIVHEAMSRLDGTLRAYGERPGCRGAIHADFTPENVLVHDGQLTIIDFDDSGDGYYLFDLATAAFFYLPHQRADEVVSALLAGYQSVRPLTSDDLSMWRPMLLARGLTYLAWAAERPGNETSDFILEHARPLVVRLATEFLASPQPPTPEASP